MYCKTHTLAKLYNVNITLLVRTEEVTSPSWQREDGSSSPDSDGPGGRLPVELVHLDVGVGGVPDG